ncbi:MAG: AlbA family DNA-binding domain-containing protein [Thermoleophilia bacterium]
MKRKKWTETEVAALPHGEHDYFERKSGQLFDEPGLLGKLAKTLSALANSGGGHMVLGVDDEGVPDGVPFKRGRTPTREWLEQQIPNLLAYPLSDFRVHVVERSTPSNIPADRDVIVVDVGDSALAPHQCLQDAGGARKYTYYYRQAGHSVPAPHFHLELLRQRLVNPVIEVSFQSLSIQDAYRVDKDVFLETRLLFEVRNTGRVAAYKWALILRGLENIPEGREIDYCFDVNEYPKKQRRDVSMRIDDTLLPACTLSEDVHMGVMLRPQCESAECLMAEIEHMIADVVVRYQVATETSPGETVELELGPGLDVKNMVDGVFTRIGRSCK